MLASDTKPRQRVRKPLAIPDIEKLPPDVLLTRRQVSLLSGFADITFKQWAAAKNGKGPKLVYVEGAPRHRVADVRAWLCGVGQ